jgi:hypothetical protein
MSGQTGGSRNSAVPPVDGCRGPQPTFLRVVSASLLCVPLVSIDSHLGWRLRALCSWRRQARDSDSHKVNVVIADRAAASEVIQKSGVSGWLKILFSVRRWQRHCRLQEPVGLVLAPTMVKYPSARADSGSLAVGSAFLMVTMVTLSVQFLLLTACGVSYVFVLDHVALLTS